MVEATFQKVICLNLNTWEAYPTGNQGYLKLLSSMSTSPESIRRDIFQKIDEGGEAGKNYNEWANTVRRDGIKNFFVISVKGETQDAANELAEKLIKDNGWKDISVRTYATKLN
ncbi:hypothetical protein L4174_017665 [Photobacterium sp. CCB-ST2H9]|uniref:hypothetical protein n=1 Tax=Photobacterium sp. CCB-ST2H9 TaxID=2912855 RepID=UPI00200689CA|nr:hypothetical protein [Photobacterium sp. CCB-ST2H9]UTM59898.1 hypothetical protein L4174_017665 [Photobacterium sp. CCB-ST2H9]